ncbi:hypothetical protein QJQ45_019668 [Haematococcus lacustris]|nr:hypothetical protein QJQ45_019668 [Haematococcus lacustris]
MFMELPALLELMSMRTHSDAVDGVDVLDFAQRLPELRKEVRREEAAAARERRTAKAEMKAAAATHRVGQVVVDVGDHEGQHRLQAAYALTYDGRDYSHTTLEEAQKLSVRELQAYLRFHHQEVMKGWLKPKLKGLVMAHIRNTVAGLHGDEQGAGMGLSSRSHPYKWRGGNAARCACCVKFAPAGSTGWVEIHVEGKAAAYRSGQSLLAIGQVTAQMSEVITACDNLKPALIPLAHRTCAEAAAAAHAVGQRLQGQEPVSQLQPMPRLCSSPTQASAQPGPAHAPCPHHLPDQPPSHPSQSQLQGSSQHHQALSAPLHLPGLSILTRPATNPVTSPAKEQQPIM